LSSQFLRSIENVQRIAEHLGNASLTYTGHSLGGGLASANALATGHDAITFNAAALSSQTKSNPELNQSPDITAYVVNGEIVDHAQRSILGLKAEGNIQYINPATPYTTYEGYKSKFTPFAQAVMAKDIYQGYRTIKSNQRIKNHMMNSVFQSLRKAGHR